MTRLRHVIVGWTIRSGIRSAALVFLAFAGCHASHRTLIARIDESLDRAELYLLARQSEDGAWRSGTYGVLRDGAPLTPHVLTTLFFLCQRTGNDAHAFHRGTTYLATLIAEHAKTNDPVLSFPVYTAAPAVWLLGLEESKESAQGRRLWLDYLLAHRFGTHLGWSTSDPAFGGWGYSVGRPRKYTLGHGTQSGLDANISATLYGLGALRASGVSRTDPIYKEVLLFVERCQNFTEKSGSMEETFDDGGFFFSPVDAVRNKAGAAGTDRNGLQRYHSYGSTTADGLRALLACGLALDHPRVIAARQWLELHFSAASNPGTFKKNREVLRNAYYFYYCWSVAHAFTRLDVRQVRTADGTVDWAAELANELLRLQRQDGTWVNHYTHAKEDDPLVATPFAAAALLICRNALDTGITHDTSNHIMSRTGIRPPPFGSSSMSPHLATAAGSSPSTSGLGGWKTD